MKSTVKFESHAIGVRHCKNVKLVLADDADAKFILSLRLDARLNQFVSAVDDSLEKQKAWLISYKQRESRRAEFYFIVQEINGKPLGTIRLYNFQKGSFCIGSWMMGLCKAETAAIEAILSAYEFAFYTLGFKRSHFDVRNENRKVTKLHKLMGAVEISSDDLDTYFVMEKKSYDEIKGKLSYLYV